MHGKTLVVFSQFVLDKLCIFEESQFIQILNTGHSHWVTNGTVHPLMNVYDSKYIAASVHLRAQIACLLMTQHAEVTINFIDVVKQTGSYCSTWLDYNNNNSMYNQYGIQSYNSNILHNHSRRLAPISLQDT